MTRTVGAFHRERGSVTAEFAIVLPAVVVVLLLVIAALQVAGRQVRLQAMAVDAARAYARGDDAAAARVAGELPGASVSKTAGASVVCAVAQVSGGGALLSGITLTARSCALDDG